MTTIDSRDLVAALRHAGVQDVDSAARRRAEYSTDASNYRVIPSVVVFPREVDEVASVLRVAREHGVPLTARGGGTSTAGNSISTGIVLDFSRHLNRVLDVDPAARTAVVEPGAVLDAISAAGAPYGLRFGPDPSSHARASIGGSLGNNSCGSRALRYGRTSDNVAEMDVLTGAGIRFDARRYGKHGLATHGSAHDLLPAVDAVVQANLGVIRTEFGRLTRQVSGYSLEHLLPENGSDLARFLVGTEGTLALVLGATVQLVETPPAVALVVLGYPDMPAAADAVPGLLPHQPVALEGMDARLVDIVRNRRGAATVPELPRGSGWLFVETSGATEAEARAAGEKLIADADCLDATVLTGAPAQALWRIREDGAGLGSRTPDGRPAWPGWEDAAVPPQRLGEYLREFSALLREHQLDALTYGHFGDGCVHARIDFPFADDPGRYRLFVTAAAQLVSRYGGSISGEHGDGRARGELLKYMYSADALAAFGQIKRAFDPTNMLNPGVLVDPAPVDADLRVPLATTPRTRNGFAYPHDEGGFAAAVHRCIGVGKCRADNTASGGVMCPSYLATRDERESTRGRARVLQEAVSGGTPGTGGVAAGGGSLVKGLRADEVRESLDLCLACKGCSSDCPTGVDMATYKAEVLHERYRRKPRPPAHYALGWLPRWARLAGLAPRLVNSVLRTPALGALVKRGGGMDPRRALPRFARKTFRDWFGSWPGRTGTPVLLWVDTFTNHFDPEVGKAAVRVLEAAGYSVQITEKPVCCGLTWISTGQLEGARRQLRKSLSALDQAVRFGIPVVGLEPSCTAVLRSELVHLLPDDPRAAAVSKTTVTLAELLSNTDGYVPPRLDGVRGIAQPHCHQHAVLGWQADAELLSGAGADVDAVGGCCGLAGNFGMERGHYDVSVAVAETALLPAVREAPFDAVVLADGFSCRTQLEQLADAHSMHLAQLLADRLEDMPPTESAREALRRQGIGGTE